MSSRGGGNTVRHDGDNDDVITVDDDDDDTEEEEEEPCRARAGNGNGNGGGGGGSAATSQRKRKADCEPSPKKRSREEKKRQRDENFKAFKAALKACKNHNRLVLAYLRRKFLFTYLVRVAAGPCSSACAPDLLLRGTRFVC